MRELEEIIIPYLKSLTT